MAEPDGATPSRQHRRFRRRLRTRIILSFLLLGWGSALTLKPFAGGVGGLRLAYAVRDAALTGQWGVPSMPCATGGDTPIPDMVWDILDRFGYRPKFNPGPDF